jgi:hypothetical protein
VVRLFPGPTIDNRNQNDQCFIPGC